MCISVCARGFMHVNVYILMKKYMRHIMTYP